MGRPLFRLGPRLRLCGELIRGGRPLCDVGSDHAYLPIWLLKTGRVPRALACDIHPGPLQSAANNARRYRVEDRLVLRESDGLRAVAPEEAEDVVIAGMGGELILRIVAETEWLRQEDRRLVLQPMSSAHDLRRGLYRLGFTILEERAVEDAGRVYTAFSVRYAGCPEEPEPFAVWMGRLAPGTEAAWKYALRQLRDLQGRLEGARRGRGEENPAELALAMEEIERRFLTKEERHAENL